HDIDILAEIPEPEQDLPVLTLVPFRQVTERGFEAHDDGTPLRVLRATAYERVPLDHLVGRLPRERVEVTDERFSVSDEDYAAIVGRVIEDEIGNGEGANFVIRRDILARTRPAHAVAALACLSTRLTDELRADSSCPANTQWNTVEGATTERHVSVEDGRVRMNPSAGTYRDPADAAGLE